MSKLLARFNKTEQNKKNKTNLKSSNNRIIAYKYLKVDFNTLLKF